MTLAGPTTGAGASRQVGLDALRGLAVLWMVAYHFCFDLNLFRLLTPPQRFLTDPFWTWQRTAIVSLFLACAGAGQAWAWMAEIPAARFWRRWVQVAGCAAGVSLATWCLFPQSWVYFGVLHGVAVMLLLVHGLVHPLWRRWPRPVGLALWPLGLLLCLAPRALAHPRFDAPALHGLGLVTRLPVTEDYVPLLPWMGVLCWGLAAGLVRARQPCVPRRVRPLPGVLRASAWLGRHSLSVYMLHQPVLMGLLMAWAAAAGRPSPF
ncbi:heparan-alpha-glucosaminide N-acetyltransferase [Ideonella livida]|uniref:DUF1624 domain-containing protein n=1 Tax=Ideonella livida TaxID=2707176 RepID=A0A7C9TIS9_9BURK|nr:heparan-alpha-glucosaminide N-acetyltransferase [Ideonella livida]NDY90644.1 DUF1624 domain-containing protein [Ideonella livida]